MEYIMRIVSVDELKTRIANILTHNEKEMSTELYQRLILDGCRFYGASLLLQSLVDERSALRISAQSSKSCADNYLLRKYAVDRYWCHSAMNACTHHNLPAALVTLADIEEFKEEPFYRYYETIQSVADR